MQAVRTSEDLRTHNKIRLLRAIHDSEADATRSMLTRQLAMGRGTVSVLVAELTAAELITEVPVSEGRRGRPTRLPRPHDRGPVALAVELRNDSWTIAQVELGGSAMMSEHHNHNGITADMFATLGERLRRYARKLSTRLIGVGISIAEPVYHHRMVKPAPGPGNEIAVADQLQLGRVPVLLGNDATLAGIAEARRGTLRGIDLALHVYVDFDVGGCLLVNGRPVTGAKGIGGEFGHMPLTGGAQACGCGAYGCWGLDVGTNALLRTLGHDPKLHSTRDIAHEAIAAAATGEPTAARAVNTNATKLGQGLGALVNAHDPRAVGLSGFAVTLYEAAPEAVHTGYTRGLMEFHRRDPPRIKASTLSHSSSQLGAAEMVFDDFFTPDRINDWSRRHN